MRRLWWIAPILLCPLCFGIWLWRSGPRNASQPSSHEELQRRVKEAVAQAVPAVVAIGGATGTIISPDGLILSATHVTHYDRTGGTKRRLNDGDYVDVVMNDGTRHRAELLGHLDPPPDVSLAKIQSDGPFPYLELDSGRIPRLGDYLLKLGHPGGYSAARGIVVRLGRVVCDEPGYFVTDSLSQGGDSGGPFIDLDGKLVGMIGGSVNFNGGVSLPYLLADAQYRSRLSVFSPPHGERKSRVLEGPILREFMPNSDLEYFVSNLQDGNRLDVTERVNQQSRRWRERDWEGLVKCLPACDWINGRRHLDTFTGLVGSSTFPVTRRIVEFFQEDERLCYGLIVDSDGTIVTRSSTLTDDARCRSSSSQQALDVELLTRNVDYDLAIVRTSAPATNLRLDDDYLISARDLAVGTILLAGNPHHQPTSVGVVSVSLQRSDGPFPRHREAPRSVYQTFHDADRVSYDRSVLPDGTFPAYIETDLHLYVSESGLPAMNLDGELVGIVIATSRVGARILPWGSVREVLSMLRDSK